MVRSSHGVRLRITAAVLVFAAGLICAEGMATHPRWAAGVINAAHTLRLTAYSAVAFRRERLVPYPAVSVSDPNLPAGIHQILEPGRVGTMWQDGIALYLTPGPGARAAAPPGRGAPAASVVAPRPAEIKVFSQRMATPPQRTIVAVGTSPDYVQAGGHFYHYGQVLVMRATAYDATAASNGRWTGQASAIGLPLNYGIAAVDPHIIPLGSRLYVEGYGMAIAADTGSAIIGERIDLFFWNSPAGIAAFGIRTLRVYVLDDPRLPPVPVPPDLRSSA